MSDLDSTRNALPFFKRESRSVSASWWHVHPTGDYLTDREIGQNYARQFLPMLKFVGGPAALCWIVNEMAKHGGAKKHRAIDDIALGFISGIGEHLQQAMGVIALARLAVDDPQGPLAYDFKARVDSGSVLNTPPFKVTTARRPEKPEAAWRGTAIGNMQVIEWAYWPAHNRVMASIEHLPNGTPRHLDIVPRTLRDEIARTVHAAMGVRA